MKKILLIAIIVGLCSCTNPSESRRALENSGYSDIETGGFAPLSCGKDDFYSTKFRAKNIKGQTVKGVVCGAPLKGYTIRF